MGTGISKMQRFMKDAGLQPIQFEFENFFTALFSRSHRLKNGAVNSAVKPPNNNVETFSRIESRVLGETVNETTAKRLINILYTLNEFSPMRISQLVVKTGISRRTLQRDITNLKKRRLLVFEGAPKTGGYIPTRKGKKFIEDLMT